MDDVYVFRAYFADYAQGRTDRMPTNDDPFQVILFAFLLVAGVTGVVFLALVTITWAQWVTLERNGVISEGEITAQRTTDDGYYITITFTPEGRDTPQQVEQIVDSLRFRQSPVGQPINMLYLPASPSVAVIADTSTAPVRDTIIAVLWNLVFVPFAVFSGRNVLAARRFARQGQRVLGEVVVATPHDDEGILTVDVRYFFTPPGAPEPVHARETILYEIPPTDFAPPPPGATVAVQVLDTTRYRVL